MAKIDVIIPVYNTAQYLTACLSSLECQTYKDFDIIAVNDGSTDSSLDILEKYQKRLNQKMIIIDKQNEGVVKARKEALGISQAPYLAFLDSDDYINSTYLEGLVTTLDKTEANLVIARFAMHFNYPFIRKIGFYDIKRSSNNVLSLKRDKKILPTINVVNTAKLFKRDYYQITDKPFEANEDLSINYLNFALADKIAYSPDSVYHYCPNNNGLVSQKLNGYSYQNLLNTILPLEELKSNFEKHNLLEPYYQEIECLFIKNIFQRISTILKSEEESEKQEKLINCVLSYMEIDFPNWKDNPYYIENFKRLEVPDVFNCLFVNHKLSSIADNRVIGNKDNIIQSYQKILK